MLAVYAPDAVRRKRFGRGVKARTGLVSHIDHPRKSTRFLLTADANEHFLSPNQNRTDVWPTRQVMLRGQAPPPTAVDRLPPV